MTHPCTDLTRPSAAPQPCAPLPRSLLFFPATMVPQVNPTKAADLLEQRVLHLDCGAPLVNVKWKQLFGGQQPRASDFLFKTEMLSLALMRQHAGGGACLA